MMRRPPIPGIVLADNWLAPYEQVIKMRLRLYDSRMEDFARKYGSLEEAARGYERMGIVRDTSTGEWIYTEWAPGARGLWLIGDFNAWNREATPLLPSSTGMWSVRLPADALHHGDHVKVHVLGADLQRHDRIPAWIHYTHQDPQSFDYTGVVWEPATPYRWKNKRWTPARIREPIIYEAHVGMAGEEPRLHSFAEFTKNVLPRIAALGYSSWRCRNTLTTVPSAITFRLFSLQAADSVLRRSSKSSSTLRTGLGWQCYWTWCTLTL